MDIVFVCLISVEQKYPGFKKVRDVCFLLVVFCCVEGSMT